MILLVSTREALVDQLMVLPYPITLKRVTDIDEVRSLVLSSGQTSETARPDLMLLDVTTIPGGLETSKALCQDERLAYLPVVALIENQKDRETVLEMGADDYLLLPLMAAEVRARLLAYLQSPISSPSILSELVARVNKPTPPSNDLHNSMVNLAEAFNARAVWLALIDSEVNLPKVVAAYNLPPIFQRRTQILQKELQQTFSKVDLNNYVSPQVVCSPYLVNNPSSETNGLTHYISVPIHSTKALKGTLNLAYPTLPALTRPQKRLLTSLSQNIGFHIESLNRQNEIQTYATQVAFIVATARLISQNLDISTILSLTLDQSVPLLNADSGEIWLLSPNGKQLDLVSSLTDSFQAQQISQLTMGQGMIAWVVEHSRMISTAHPMKHPAFDPTLDQVWHRNTHAILAVPLRHHDETIGVLAVYRPQLKPFTDGELALLEGTASLATSAIANARLMQELRDYGQQQSLLYEMSQQIASGLKLSTALSQAVQWISRLCQAEAVLLWLVNDNQQEEITLNLMGALGLDVPRATLRVAFNDRSMVGRVLHIGEPMMSNNPPEDTRFKLVANNLPKLIPRNLISVPMMYRRHTIGVLSIINKQNSDYFDEDDLRLASTAVEMIAIAVGNARLYSRAISLMEEREHLHQQAIQSERLAMVGRLTAALSHEINNPMQAIQGALTLALEDLDSPEDLETYLELSLQESRRVVQLVSRMREIYRPSSHTPSVVNLNDLIQEALTIARKELKRKSITLKLNLAKDLQPVKVISNQIHLVLLNLLLNISDSIGQISGGDLTISTQNQDQQVVAQFLTHVIIQLPEILFQNGPSKYPQQEDNLAFSLSLSRDILEAHNGKLTVEQPNQQTLFQIVLNASQD